MSIVEQLMAEPQYSLTQAEKHPLLVEELALLNAHHCSGCDPYRRLFDTLQHVGSLSEQGIASIPFLPVRLFKGMKLQSIDDEMVYKVLTSSGTSMQEPSRIAVDRETSLLQTRGLASIITSFLGPRRLPMIIIDSRAVLQNRQSLSARAAGLVGLANFGRDHFFALDDRMQLDVAGVKAYAEKHAGERLLVFGFTYMVWQYFYEELKRLGEFICLDDSILIHSGGWKKLQEQAVSNERFRAELLQQCGIRRVFNFYGMIEQVGSIYMECERGFFHAPNFAEVLIRDHRNWKVLPPGATGVIQTLSILPRSYPGHSLLTEDLGTVHGSDDCPCGRKGTYFTVQGRMSRSELRGCSDTHAFQTGKGEVEASSATVIRHIPAPVMNLSPEQLCPDVFFSQTLLTPFSQEVVAFFEQLSRDILRTAEIKRYPELVAIAYWLRKAHIYSMTTAFTRKLGVGESVMPRGVSFHVAPANVDTIFLYSWALSLLAGNLNLVRISRQSNPQLAILLEVIRATLSGAEWRELAARNIIISYPHDVRINGFLSARADVRLIWGGDTTVQEIRSLPTKVTTKDVVFADKVSSALVHADRYLLGNVDDNRDIARLFFNDAYQFDQMACSSARTVWFVGAAQACAEASERFWRELALEVKRRNYRQGESVAMDKLVITCTSVGNGIAVLSSPALHAGEPTVLRIAPEDVPADLEHCGGGLFHESFIRKVEDLAEFVKPKDQTLSYVGFTADELQAVSGDLCMKGFDRIVPFGQALTFSPVWDGYDLFTELTRRVTVE